ncbi:MAG TPA: hypothetical protein VHG91_06025 [Longimicrobium sp.]|nr:hypothetical protein [Longimicrobium sp.]
MSDAPPLEHPAEIRRLCDEAIAGFEALAAADPGERGRLVPGLRALLERIDEAVEEADLLHPDFAREQGWLVDASSALQSIDLDRGGPHVPRFVERAVADLRRVAGP